MAVSGAANKTPINPQIIPQKINDKIMVIGCKPKLSPKILGSTILPIIWWTMVGKTIINITKVGSVYCKNAIGNGSRTAITDAITGIKLSI